jgi:hypothetical protein
MALQFRQAIDAVEQLDRALAQPRFDHRAHGGIDGLGIAASRPASAAVRSATHGPP